MAKKKEPVKVPSPAKFKEQAVEYAKAKDEAGRLAAVAKGLNPSLLAYLAARGEAGGKHGKSQWVEVEGLRLTRVYKPKTTVDMAAGVAALREAVKGTRGEAREMLTACIQMVPVVNMDALELATAQGYVPKEVAKALTTVTPGYSLRYDWLAGKPCEKCGAEMDDAAKFCPECGHKVA